MAGRVMKIYMTGGDGQLGTDLMARLGDHEVLAPLIDELDLREADEVIRRITEFGPDLVIHTAAMTAVDLCETEQDMAFAINRDATATVAKGAAEAGAHLLYVSTDYVFDGTKDGPYVETDTPNPASVYGASKLAGEEAAGPDATIARTSWVVGTNAKNMLKTILGLAETHPELSFVSDQVGHPTFTADLAGKLIELGTGRHSGLFHVTNQGAVSWHGFAQAVLEAAGHDPERVKPVKTEDLDPPRPAPRPANSVLENAALRAAGIAVLPDFHEPLKKAVADLQNAG